MLDREPLPGAAEPGHDLVGNHQDAVLVAERADALHVAVRRHQDAVGAGDALEDEAGDGVRPLEDDHFLQVRKRRRRIIPAAFDAVVGVEDVDDARQRRLRPASWIAGRRDRGGRAAVVRTIARENLLPPGDGSRDLDGVLVRLGPAVGEEEDVDVARSERRQLRPEPGPRLGRHERVGIRERRSLILDRLHHPRIAVADVHAHQLAVEVDVALAFGRPEVDPLRPCDGDRVDGILCRPLEDGVFLTEGDDLVAGHSVPL